MKIASLFAAFLLFLSSFALAQSSGWMRTFEGMAPEGMLQLPDSSTIVFGLALYKGKIPSAVTRLDRFGNVLWTHVDPPVSPANHVANEFLFANQLSDGSILLVSQLTNIWPLKFQVFKISSAEKWDVAWTKDLDPTIGACKDPIMKALIPDDNRQGIVLAVNCKDSSKNMGIHVDGNGILNNVAAPVITPPVILADRGYEFVRHSAGSGGDIEKWSNGPVRFELDWRRKLLDFGNIHFVDCTADGGFLILNISNSWSECRDPGEPYGPRSCGRLKKVGNDGL